MLKVKGLTRYGWGPFLLLLFTLLSNGLWASSAEAAACAPTSSTNGANTVLTFTSIGTCTWTVPSGVTSISVLIVAGGGGGGGDAAGGGGAGGVYANTNYSVTALRAETVTVGAGGAGGQCSSGNAGSCSSPPLATSGYIAPTSGGPSVFSTISAPGGGQGGVYNGGAGGNGGSGGGGGAENGVGGTATATGSNYFGFAGGTSTGGGGAGGGGAGHVGFSGGPGKGGDGYQSAITGTNTYYAGGGGGGAQNGATRALGGLGGGGNGSSGCSWNYALGTDSNQAQPGAPNSGGGGGGAPYGCNGSAGNGGSGVVIISYLTTAPTITSLALANTLKSAVFRATNTIQATLTSDATVRFYAQGKVIPGCSSIRSISSIASCSWKPNIHGSQQISARVISGTSSAILNLEISQRTSKR